MSIAIEKPDVDNCTTKQWEKWWWQDFNTLCKRCKNECKQSFRVKVECPKFKKV